MTIFFLSDFKSESNEKSMKSFCQIHNFKNLFDKPTCHKNPTNPSCIGPIITIIVIIIIIIIHDFFQFGL